MTDETPVKKIALVTGASRGIGQSILRALSETYFVIGTGTTEDSAEGITASLKEHGKEGLGMAVDFSSQASFNGFIKKLKEADLKPSVLVNNAGITSDNLAFRTSFENWNETFQVNLATPFQLTAFCLRHMIRKRWGRVVNISSVIASIGQKGQSSYCSSKAGLEGMTRSLALEFAAKGITVNAVAPGYIETKMTDDLSPEHKAFLMEQIPMKRVGVPEDISGVVQFLIGENSSYITGQVIHVNGGLYCS